MELASTCAFGDQLDTLLQDRFICGSISNPAMQTLQIVAEDPQLFYMWHKSSVPSVRATVLGGSLLSPILGGLSLELPTRLCRSTCRASGADAVREGVLGCPPPTPPTSSRWVPREEVLGHQASKAPPSPRRHPVVDERGINPFCREL
ncbi:hypothetical protein HPB47_013579 [Ixodes persulcatus]|uniref:Uncharacterized protein n=1 Tax=Ixodes persulcatus TaxID=34615 RepID=A0AC60QY50_IXOPE|nr:hypothetical protein HPB47_013579 [Ixodes persulcatus]